MCRIKLPHVQRKGMGVGLTDAEFFKLIKLWKEEGNQEQLEGVTRNKQVYAKLANSFSSMRE